MPFRISDFVTFAACLMPFCHGFPVPNVQGQQYRMIGSGTQENPLVLDLTPEQVYTIPVPWGEEKEPRFIKLIYNTVNGFQDPDFWRAQPTQIHGWWSSRQVDAVLGGSGTGWKGEAVLQLEPPNVWTSQVQELELDWLRTRSTENQDSGNEGMPGGHKQKVISFYRGNDPYVRDPVLTATTDAHIIAQENRDRLHYIQEQLVEEMPSYREEINAAQSMLDLYQLFGETYVQSKDRWRSHGLRCEGGTLFEGCSRT